MTSAYVPDDAADDSMTPRERLLRIVVIVVVAVGAAALLVW